MLKSYDPKIYWTDNAEQYFSKGEYYEKQHQDDGFFLSGNIFIENIRKLPHQSLLEVGCGYGYRFQQILSSIDDFDNYTGVDISPTMIQLFRRYKYNNKVKELIIGDVAEGLKFSGDCFDLVFCCGVLMHNRYQNTIKILKEMKRVSKKHLLILEDTITLHHAINHRYLKMFDLLDLKLLLEIELPSLMGVTKDKLMVVEKI